MRVVTIEEAAHGDLTSMGPRDVQAKVIALVTEFLAPPGVAPERNLRPPDSVYSLLMPDLPSDTPGRLQAALEGRYRLERLLGQGGMATVWIAEDIRHERKVAIKVLRADLAAALGSDRFLREIRIAAQLQHPHILGLIDSGEITGPPDRNEGSLLYYVMPLVDGESLRERLDRQGPVPVALVVRWLREVADALAKAHRAGIIHRDIKPDNILIADQHALVVDFGVARAVSDAAPQSMLTGVDVTVGTPAYMAPEQVVADPTLDHRADLYSLGIVGYEMLAGHPPFTIGSPQQLLAGTGHPAARRRSRSSGPTPRPASPPSSCGSSPRNRPSVIPTPMFSWLSSSRSAPARIRFPFRRSRPPPQPPPAKRGRVIGVMAGIAIAAAITVFALRPRAPKTAVADDGRSLAVLPLTNLSADSGQDYFSDGLSEEILGAVSRIPGLRVAAHTSSFALKGTKLPVGEIGQKLGVRHVLEGSVQREGDNVRVRARLVDASSGFQVWDGKYDKQASNLFALEDEVAAAIAAAITTHLGVPVTDAPRAAGGTLDAAAHDAYLRGRQALRQRSGAVDLMQAIAQFQAALVLDSTYARAWAGLGTAQVLLPEYGGAPVPQATAEARRAIMRALALDSTSAEAQAALGYLQKSYEWDWKAAEASYDRALALDPNAAGTWQWYGELLETVARHDDAGKAFGKSVALDPVSAVAQMALGAHLVTVGDRSAGRAAFEQSLELQPRLWPALLQLMFLEMEDGHIARAADYARRAAPLLGFEPDKGAEMVTRPDAAHLTPAAATIEEWMAEGRLPDLAGASWLALLGADDRAFVVLQRMVKERAPFSSYIPWWPFLGGLATDPRMKAIGSDILGSGGIAIR
jgi:serine/threonine-protein kinase